eukprot:9473359-Pyramimonas_sp.AAC.1
MECTRMGLSSGACVYSSGSASESSSISSEAVHRGSPAARGTMKERVRGRSRSPHVVLHLLLAGRGAEARPAAVAEAKGAIADEAALVGAVWMQGRLLVGCALRPSAPRCLSSSDALSSSRESWTSSAHGTSAPWRSPGLKGWASAL